MTVKIDGARLKIPEVVRVARPAANGALREGGAPPGGARTDRRDPRLYRPDLDA